MFCMTYEYWILTVLVKMYRSCDQFMAFGIIYLLIFLICHVVPLYGFLAGLRLMFATCAGKGKEKVEP